MHYSSREVERCLEDWDFKKLKKLIDFASKNNNQDNFRYLIDDIERFLLSEKNIFIINDHVNILFELLKYEPMYVSQLILTDYKNSRILSRIRDKLANANSNIKATFFEVEKIVREGFNIDGYDEQGFNREGRDRDGYDRSGFNANGLDRQGFGSDGYNSEGYDLDGFNRDGLDRDGFNRDGYDQDGYNRSGYNKNGINSNGFISLEKWHEIVNLSTLPSSCQSEWLAEEAYSEINDHDLALATCWANAEKDNDYTMARMLSARVAEKIAGKFYQSLGFEVDDVSIKQITSDLNTTPNDDSNKWQLYDLLLNKRISIDVKNSRTPYSSDATYVEHCVSRFKKDRRSQNVIIAGVLSPYLQLSYIQEPNKIHYEATVKYLGETTISDFTRLEERFGRRFLRLSINATNFIPRWMFEFPDKFYEMRNQRRLQLQQIAIELMPTIEECGRFRVNPIPAYLSSGISFPDVWKADLKAWQIDFYTRIRPRDKSVATMPVLFLALLVHFLEAVTQDKKWKDYDPELYRQLLYNSTTDENLQMPLGIFDPLKTINSFIETLAILWTNKEHTKLNEFCLFKFNGVGLLEGKRLNKEKYETILAYCGGFIDGKGKCGNYPLILGKHENCPSCGKLICEKCGHCSATCQQCERRMKSVSKSSDRSVAKCVYHDFIYNEKNLFADEMPF